MPDHWRGYVRRGKGVFPRDVVMAGRYRRRARHERVRFESGECAELLRVAAEACGRPSRGWTLHAGVAVFNHVHLLIGWATFFEAGRVMSVLHGALTVGLRDARGEAAGRPLLARGGSVKRVRDEGHFHHLRATYLPGHRRYGGVLWEGA